MEYRADQRDIAFQLFDWLPTEELLGDEQFGDWDRESVEMAIAEAARIAREELAPGNEEGDRQGARLDGGEVTLPESFQSGYSTVAEGGWVGSTSSTEHGGLGLPHVVGTAVNELFAGSNLSLTLVFLLTRGVGELVENHGSEELKRIYCNKLTTGAWAGTMCLTEPHAGSDVGASTATAEPLGEGRYRIRGEKIFITFGEHRLTPNIVHAVLARLPGAPTGTRGLSLFIVPKLRVDSDGTPGEPNDVRCASIEEKLGIHGSPTCSILFGSEGRCEGHLLGEEHSGIRLMFELMNAARIEVGLQGMAVASAAHQAALAYAREREQGRHWTRLREREAPSVPIVEHPDVRRMLFTSGAFVQAMRALLLKTSYHIDRSRWGDESQRSRHASYVEVLTPICKAWASDWGFRVTEWCLQVYGGYGYSRDYPAEQYLRDSKITSIYEGTNGIQALDLVGRKMAREREAVSDLLGETASIARGLSDDPELGAAAALLLAALGELQAVAEVPKGDDGALLMMLNAVPVLDMMGHVLGAGHLLEQAQVAQRQLRAIADAKSVESSDRAAWRAFLEADAEAAFLHNKLLTAVHFAHRVLPAVAALAAPIKAGERAAVDAIL